MSASILTDNHIYPRSTLSGRERWHIEGMLNQPVLAKHLSNYLSKQPGMIQVTANPMTGRILLLFDPSCWQTKTIQRLLKQAIQHCQMQGGCAASLCPSRKTGLDGFKQRLNENHLYSLVQRIEDEQCRAMRHTAMRASAINSFFKILSPIMTGLMISSVLSPIAVLTKIGLSQGAQLAFFTGAFGLSKGAESVTAHYKNKHWSKYSNEIDKKMSERVFAHIQSLPMPYLDSQSPDKLQHLVSHDVDIIKRFLNYTPAEFTDKATTMVFSSVIILAISPIAFALCLLPVPLITKLNKRHQASVREQASKAGALTDNYRKVLSNNLNGLSTVKSFTAERIEFERFCSAKDTACEHTVRLDKENSYYSSTSELIFVMGIMGPVVYGCMNVLRGGIGTTEFMVQIGIAPSILNSATGLEYGKSLYRDAKAAATRLSAVLSIEPEMISRDDQQPLTVGVGGIEFSNIHFGYDQHKVIKGVSFEVMANKKVAFVGPTGSGKSTLIKLLLGFYQAQQGQVYIDGKNIEQVSLKSLRQSIALVSQEPFLFNGSIYDNLVYGRPDATFDEVVAACKIAQAFEFIDAHPDGFNAQIGERGHKLSGGQRQRLSIARAVLKNAAILILDEATSAVDNKTEAAIRQAVDLISHTCTVIIIAHRLSSIRYVDTIYHIKDGEISEAGTHEQLLARNGDYAALWQLQVSEQGNVPAIR
ncbi:ABC transporter ATP-binding protein/permease [Pseudoalteromonas sp. OOF1S-7]|uniref:ABC transporter ATP-binding protein/permease n=1 Tax=Pseudoalteromonas sp. OOF1S-7 TaxID=2917757 RepID=UPI001EF6900C|nr:ABC transporter ATP-binding protein/permease [Pseudoalteromonas sp. OOF1S-7]MCG7534089.1 ABC transporter ATP-binding protein/permease [Pseudoalteromonas sp. OOF1S-7]